MGTLLAFAPFIIFAVVDRVLGSVPGLVAGAATAGVLLLRDALVLRRPTKLLKIGTLLLFGGLALLASFGSAGWSIVGVRLRVDAGLLLIILISIAIRRPFTLQYAREQVASQFWQKPAFLRTNMVISSVWALAFAVLVAADVVMLELPQVSVRVGIFVTIAALLSAIKFTAWYPERLDSDPSSSAG